jgi:hypothetical protein
MEDEHMDNMDGMTLYARSAINKASVFEPFIRGCGCEGGILPSQSRNQSFAC